MAFSVKVTGLGLFPEHTWMQDMVSWWPEHELKKDPRFREVHEDDGYVDYVAILSPTEALWFHNLFCGKAHDHNKEAMMKLGQRLAQKAPALCWVAVNIYEWESGL